jgi:amphi-Trp domain-containing protein
MSDTAELSYGQGKMLTYDAALILDAIASDLRQGSLPLATAGEAVPARVTLPANAKIEIEFKGKVKPGKSKHKLAIEITWKEKDEAAEEAKAEGRASGDHFAPHRPALRYRRAFS